MPDSNQSSSSFSGALESRLRHSDSQISWREISFLHFGESGLPEWQNPEF